MADEKKQKAAGDKKLQGDKKPQQSKKAKSEQVDATAEQGGASQRVQRRITARPLGCATATTTKFVRR